MIYEKEHLNKISFPLGGIGTGSVGLAGNGNLVDWEIFNRPNKGGVAGNGYNNFIVRVTEKNGTSHTRVLIGDVTENLTGSGARFGLGAEQGTMCGYPHFRNVVFRGEFPIAELTFSDPDFPGEVLLRAFNPLIPGDADASSVPAAFFEVEYKNPFAEEAEFAVFFTVSNPYPESSENLSGEKNGMRYVKLFHSGVPTDSPDYGDITIACDDVSAAVQTYWYRGSWMDGISVFWHEVSQEGKLKTRAYPDAAKNDHGAVSAARQLSRGENVAFRFVLSWNVPNNACYWEPLPDEKENGWKNYYATLFSDSTDSAAYAFTNWDVLYKKTKCYRDSLFASTLDPAVIDAAASTLSVIKTATVLRLENGEFYGWEGMYEKTGSCEGTCQHVWNYAYALCFLFPDLERSIRDLEFDYSTDDDGKMQFRLFLPLGKRKNMFLPCVDGQMGAVIKTYREWKISGDDAWLKRRYKKLISVLDYAWSEKNDCRWDNNRDGVLEGRQHHTLDVELFGPSSWLEGFYLAALVAGSEIAEYMGDTEKAREYREIYEKGKAWTDKNLFNGEYFIQKINLADKSIPAAYGEAVAENYWNEEYNEMKYQIGEGCEIDQLCGQWHADILGLGDLFDPEKVQTALKSMYRYNFVPSMRQIANLWRVFSLNDESGAIICAYPQGKYKPVIPIPYCEESMHGFEYAFAGLLISRGMIEEGLTVVRSVRARYNGEKRNPWNEIECGSNYARSMASFALIPIFAGFTFDMPKKTIGFQPIEQKAYFRTIWSLACGWGNFIKDTEQTRITVESGGLCAKHIKLPYLQNVQSVVVDGTPCDFTFENGKLTIAAEIITSEIVIR